MQHITYIYTSPEGPRYRYDLDVVRQPGTHEILDVKWRGGQSIYGLINAEKLDDIGKQADTAWVEELAKRDAALNSPEQVALREANRRHAMVRAEAERTSTRGT